MSLERKLDQFLAQLTPDRIEVMVVGCSGGVDSMVLMHALSRKEEIERLVVCNVDHGLHSDSQMHQQHVQTQAKMLGLEYHGYRASAETIASGNGVEDGARAARYACFDACRKTVHADYVALGHHASDQLETFFIRLSQGSGVRGLGGIREIREHLIRPLLSCSRAEIRHYAERYDISYIKDPTNTDERFLRNSIRSSVLPVLDVTLGMGWRAHLSRVMEELQRRHLEDVERVSAYRKRIVCPVKFGVRLDREAMETMSRTDGELLLKNCLETIADVGGPKRIHIEALRSLAVDGPSTSRMSLGGELWGVAEYRHLFIGRLFEPHHERVVVTHTGNFSWRDWVFSFEGPLSEGISIRVPMPTKSSPLVIRAIEKGDIFVRGGHRKKLSKLLIDIKVPKRLRRELPLIEHQGSIIWGWTLADFSEMRKPSSSECTLWMRVPVDFVNSP